MIELWTFLAPILLADVINPVLFAFMVYSVGTGRPLINSSMALLGHTVAYLAFGIGLAYAFETIQQWLANPRPLDYAIGLLIGVLLLWFAWRIGKASKPVSAIHKEPQLTSLKAFGIGALINIAGLPFALPYFAALNKIIEADLSLFDSLLIIGGYNLAYALPFIIVPGMALALGKRSRPILARINEKVDRASAVLMPILLGIVGLALVADAVWYFVGEEGLF